MFKKLRSHDAAATRAHSQCYGRVLIRTAYADKEERLQTLTKQKYTVFMVPSDPALATLDWLMNKALMLGPQGEIELLPRDRTNTMYGLVGGISSCNILECWEGSTEGQLHCICAGHHVMCRDGITEW